MLQTMEAAPESTIRRMTLRALQEAMDRRDNGGAPAGVGPAVPADHPAEPIPGRPESTT